MSPFEGTARSDTVRCEARGVVRTSDQREAAIRFWLELADDDPLPSAPEVERRFMAELDRINVAYPVTSQANFRALARGGCRTIFHSSVVMLNMMSTSIYLVPDLLR